MNRPPSRCFFCFDGRTVSVTCERHSVTELTRLAREKKQASLQPMIDEFTQTDKRLVELRKSIREVNPEWNPPTLADRIQAFIKSKGKATTEEIVKEFSGSATPFLTKNVLKKKTDTLWTTKDGKFSAVAPA